MPGKSPLTRRSVRGFTLAEMVVVLLILGIIAAVTLPALRGPPRNPLADAIDEVARVLRTGRSAALEAGAAVTVSIDATTRSYLVERVADSGSETLAQGTMALDQAVTLRGTIPRVRFHFDRQGTVAADSLVVLGPFGSRPVILDRWTGELVSGDARGGAR